MEEKKSVDVNDECLSRLDEMRADLWYKQAISKSGVMVEGLTRENINAIKNSVIESIKHYKINTKLTKKNDEITREMNINTKIKMPKYRFPLKFADESMMMFVAEISNQKLAPTVMLRKDIKGVNSI
jgi:hypothetical protein